MHSLGILCPWHVAAHPGLAALLLLDLSEAEERFTTLTARLAGDSHVDATTANATANSAETNMLMLRMKTAVMSGASR